LLPLTFDQHMTVEEQPISVTIIGGYLGAGKTTLVNHLLRNANGKKLAILVNEFGALPIDADLIEAQDDTLISLAGGCVCCSYGNDLMTAMEELRDSNINPDHVVLESSGVAIPAMIAGSLSILEGFSTDGIVTLADAETVRQRATDKFLADTIARQFDDADIILLNKTDLISQTQVAEVHAWLEAVAPKAKILTTRRAEVPLEVVLQANHRDYLPKNTDHRQIDGFETKTIVPDVPVNPASFAEQLISQTPELIRAKGHVPDLDGKLKTIQIVGKRVEISTAPSGVTAGLVTIWQKSPQNP